MEKLLTIILPRGRSGFLVLLTFVLSAGQLSAGETSSEEPSAEEPSAKCELAEATQLASLKKAYALCVEYRDSEAALSLAYQLAVLDEASAEKWKEEILKVHFSRRNYTVSLRILNDLDEAGLVKGNHVLMEMKALCHEAADDKEEAVAIWKKLWEQTNRPKHAMRLSGLQFELKRFIEAGDTVEAGLEVIGEESEMVLSPTGNGEMQQVPVKAALYNQKALVLAKNLGPNWMAETKEALRNALAVAPDFELAKRNMAGLKGSE